MCRVYHLGLLILIDVRAMNENVKNFKSNGIYCIKFCIELDSTVA